MPKFIQKAILSLCSAFLFLSISTNIADATRVIPDPILKPLFYNNDAKDYHDYGGDNHFDVKNISEKDTSVVDVYFVLEQDPKTTLANDFDLFLCFKSDLNECQEEDNLYTVKNDEVDLGLDPKYDNDVTTEITNKFGASFVNNVIRTRVCGTGSADLNGPNKCKDNKDKHYFHGGMTHTVTLLEKPRNDKNAQLNEVAYAQFYVEYYAPNVIFSFGNSGITGDIPVAADNPKANDILQDELEKRQAKTPLITEGLPIHLTIKLNGLKQKKDQQNNYHISISGPNVPKTGGEGYACKTIKANQNAEFKVPPLRAGSYRILISEQVGDTNSGWGRFGKVWKDLTSIESERRFAPDCNKGIVYWNIPLTIKKEGSENNYRVTIDNAERDPAGDFKIIDEIGAGKLPCAGGKLNDANSCDSINLGLPGLESISTNPELFVTDLFEFVLGIAGSIAFIIFIWNGYKLLTSHGDKQKIADSRERITAAIIGLLFIIFSFVILEFIGIDILRVPGFER